MEHQFASSYLYNLSAGLEVVLRLDSVGAFVLFKSGKIVLVNNA
jgi:hypothetical protein